MEDALRTYQLTKAFKGAEVVSRIDMRIRKGEIYGFLGPNGAGKTTVMRMITNLVKPTAGEVEIFGRKLTPTSYEIFKRISGIIEYPIFYEHMSARDNLDIHCEYMGFYDKNAIGEALELVGLSAGNRKPVKDYSLGMKQRFGIARAICTKPELLILDEPTNGMDPVGIHELRELFRKLSKEHGMTLLISTHILQEIGQIADTIGVINQGRLLEEISMDKVRSQHSEFIELVTPDSKHAAFVLEDRLGVTNFKMMGSQTIRVYEPKLSPVELARSLVLNDVGIEALNKKNGSLEDYFLRLIQGGVPDA